MPLTHDVVHTEIAVRPPSPGAAQRLSLPGRLSLPESAVGLVVLPHGSGSSRVEPAESVRGRRAP